MATVDMVIFCFDTLSAHLHGHDEPFAPFDETEEFPMFITWKKEDPHDGLSLRGCIGTLSATPLKRMRHYVLQSAFQDRRFHPIQPCEFQELHCSVSLLTHYEEASHYEDWVIGKHGITINFEAHNQQYNATYLPEVAREQGWNHAETLRSLIRKAGYKQNVTDDFLQSVHITRYQSSKQKLSYTEYHSTRVNRS